MVGPEVASLPFRDLGVDGLCLPFTGVPWRSGLKDFRQFGGESAPGLFLFLRSLRTAALWRLLPGCNDGGTLSNFAFSGLGRVGAQQLRLREARGSKRRMIDCISSAVGASTNAKPLDSCVSWLRITLMESATRSSDVSHPLMSSAVTHVGKLPGEENSKTHSVTCVLRWLDFGVQRGRIPIYCHIDDIKEWRELQTHLCRVLACSERE